MKDNDIIRYVIRKSWKISILLVVGFFSSFIFIGFIHPEIGYHRLVAGSMYSVFGLGAAMLFKKDSTLNLLANNVVFCGLYLGLLCSASTCTILFKGKLTVIFLVMLLFIVLGGILAYLFLVKQSFKELLEKIPDFSKWESVLLIVVLEAVFLSSIMVATIVINPFNF